MPLCVPRRSWQSSMIGPMYSFGVRIDASIIGSRISAIRPGSGKSDGMWTSISELSVSVTSKRTDGIVAMSVDVVLALEALAHDVHVQQAEEAAAKAEAQRLGHLRLPRQRGVVELELLERVAQVGVLVGVDRKQAAEDDRLDVAVAGQRLEVAVARPAVLRRQRVADGERRDLLDAGDDEADLAGRELVASRPSPA